MYGIYPELIATPNGEFIVSWVNLSYPIPGADLYLQRYTATGEKIGVNYRVNNFVGGVGYALSDIVIIDGHVAVGWRGILSSSIYRFRREIFAQIMPLEKIGFFTPGDLNYDDQITPSDLIILINYMFRRGSQPEGNELVGDMNQDCKVSIGDLVYLINYLFRGGEPPKPSCLGF